MAKHIGIVAVSSEGAALCYQTICQEAVPLMGKHNHPELSMHTFPLAEHVKHIVTGDREKLGKLMAESAQKLIDIGAEIIICPDNTNHIAFEEATKRSDATWLHIAEEVCKCAKEAGVLKLGITGTKYLMESDVYPSACNHLNISTEIPKASDRERLNDIIFDELVSGVFLDSSRVEIIGILEKLKSQGCDAVVMGCTEIPLIIRNGDSPLPTFDSTRILARAALREALA